MNTDNEWLKQLHAEQNEERAIRLLEARKQAELDGKEAFHWETLRSLYCVLPAVPACEETPELLETRRYELEEKYYLRYPEVKTLAEFAALLSSLDVYKDA